MLAAARIGGVMTSVEPSGRPDDALLRAVAGAFADALNAHDAARAAEVFTEDAVMEDPAASEAVVRGRPAIRAYFESWLRAFPDAQMSQEVLFTPLEGDEYASRWRIWGTMDGDLRPPGFAATHRRVETEGVAVIRLSGSQVASLRQFYDTTEVGRQLGAAPPRGSRAEQLGVLAQRLSVAVRARMQRS
jgi:steroid delta-isomerase-like uncharacterized protein